MEKKTQTKKLSRTLPHNLEAEQSLLGCILVDSEQALEILSALGEDDFYTPTHKTVLTAMKEVSSASKPVDFVTVADQLDRDGLMSAIGGISTISNLNNMVPSAANFRFYLDIVKRDSTMRKLIHSCSSIIEQSYASGDRDKMLAIAEKEIYDINSENISASISVLKESIGGVLSRFDAIHRDKDAFSGLKVGFRALDKMTNGFHGGDLVIIAARPGMGKTSLAMNMVENVAVKSHSCCVVFSLEMPKAQIAQRMLCSAASVPMSDALSGELQPEQWKDLWKASDLLSAAKIFVDDSSMITPAEILSKSRRIKSRYGLDMIMIDYIQLMSSGKNKVENRQQEISEITRTLKIIAKELDVPVIALSQLSREVEGRQTKRPQLSDLRESGAIEQDADMVMFIYRPATAEEDASATTMDVELIVAKHRNGPVGDVPLQWMSEIVRFRDGDRYTQALTSQFNQNKQEQKEKTNPTHLASAEVFEDVPLPDLENAPEELQELQF